jgi:hypothetical protein
VAEATWGELMKTAQIASQPIAEGEHNIKIVSAEATRASTGSLMFKYKAEILDGPDVKRKLYGNLVVSPDNGTALAIFFRNMESLGLDANFFAANPSPDQVASAMMNRQAKVSVKHKTWQGVVRGEIDRWLGAPGQGGLGLGPVAPGTVTGPAGPPLPTSATPAAAVAPAVTPSAPTTSPQMAKAESLTPGPVAPTDAPPALPI